MSSPNINNCIIVGCILCYITVILHGLDSSYLPASVESRICNVMVMTLSFGFTLSFGALFSKTWRVYKIFSGARRNVKTAVKDRQLYFVIAGLLFVDIVILLAYMMISPFRLEDTQIVEKLYTKRDMMEVTTRQHCNCEHRLLTMLLLFSFKVILLLFGLFIAWETRKVTIPILNDSKHIGIAVYIVAVISIVGTICASALNSTSHAEGGYFVVSLSICLCTTVTLMLVFLPKVALLFSHDDEARRRSVSSNSISSISGGIPLMVDTYILKINEEMKTLPIIEEEENIIKKYDSKARSVSFEESVLIN